MAINGSLRSRAQDLKTITFILAVILSILSPVKLTPVGTLLSKKGNGPLGPLGQQLGGSVSTLLDGANAGLTAGDLANSYKAVGRDAKKSFQIAQEQGDSPEGVVSTEGAPGDPSAISGLPEELGSKAFSGASGAADAAANAGLGQGLNAAKGALGNVPGGDSVSGAVGSGLVDGLAQGANVAEEVKKGVRAGKKRAGVKDD